MNDELNIEEGAGLELAESEGSAISHLLEEEERSQAEEQQALEDAEKQKKEDEAKREAEANEPSDEQKERARYLAQMGAHGYANLLGRFACPSVANVESLVDTEAGEAALYPLALQNSGDMPPWVMKLLELKEEYQPWIQAGMWAGSSYLAVRKAELLIRQAEELGVDMELIYSDELDISVLQSAVIKKKAEVERAGTDQSQH